MIRTFSVLVILMSAVWTAEIYDHKKSYVTYLGNVNWENQINKIRQTTKQVSLVQFYKSNDYDSKDFAPKFDQMAKDYKGMLRIGAVDCNQEQKLCEKEKIKKYPTFRLFPPQPVPAMDYDGELDTKKMSSWAVKFIQSNVIEVTAQNADTFIQDSPSVPKVFLFTNKKGVPLIMRALSVSFENKLFFGIVRESESAVLKRYNVKEFPKIIVVKATERKPIVYSGEINFNSIFEFLNIYSETFVAGGGSSQDSAATKSWLADLVPEVHEKSLNDICVNQESTLCVILFNKERPTEGIMEHMRQVAKKFEKKVQRGSNFKVMWISSQLETKWVEMFNVSEIPSIVVLNPGRRKRFVLHAGEVTFDNIISLIEKINSGDARFVPVKGNQLESLSSRDWNKK